MVNVEEGFTPEDIALLRRGAERRILSSKLRDAVAAMPVDKMIRVPDELGFTRNLLNKIAMRSGGGGKKYSLTRCDGYFAIIRVQ